MDTSIAGSGSGTSSSVQHGRTRAASNLELLRRCKDPDMDVEKQERDMRKIYVRYVDGVVTLAKRKRIWIDGSDERASKPVDGDIVTRDEIS